MNKNIVPIYESKGSDRIVKYKNISEFSEEFQNLYKEDFIWGVFYRDEKLAYMKYADGRYYYIQNTY